MARFKPGQKITPKIKPKWESVNGTPAFGPLPEFGKEYTANGYDTPEDGIYFVFLKECHPKDSFDDRLFEPLVSDSVLREELESVPEPFTKQQQ